MSRSPPPNTGTRCGSSACRACASSGNAATRMDAPEVAGRNDALACRLMNRSALLLLATAVRASNGTSRSSSRVRNTRMPGVPRAMPSADARWSTSVSSPSARRHSSCPHRPRRVRGRASRCGWPRPAVRTQAARRGPVSVTRRPSEHLAPSTPPSHLAPAAIDDQRVAASRLDLDDRYEPNRGPRSTANVTASTRRMATRNAPGCTAGIVRSSALGVEFDGQVIGFTRQRARGLR